MYNLQKRIWKIYCDYRLIPRVYRETPWGIKWERSSKAWSFLYKHYHQVHVVEQVYPYSFEEFIKDVEPRRWDGALVEDWYPRPKKRTWRSKRGRRRWRSWCRRTIDRQLKFKKKPHHQKKVLSEDEVRKREWRARKKDPRDQHLWTRRRRKQHECQEHRRRERQQWREIANGRVWEDYPTSSCYWEQNIWWDSDKKDVVVLNLWDYNYPENDWDAIAVPKRRGYCW